MEREPLWSVYIVTERDGVRVEALVDWELSIDDALSQISTQCGNGANVGFVLREMVPQS